jgi:outer membrane receptor protein involved in Fe transport
MFLQDTPPVTESYITAPRAEQTVPRSAASTTVLSAEDLRRTGERTLPRMIAKAAGVGTFLQETNTGGGAPILRGLIGERVLIVVDGVRLNDGTTRTGPNQSLNTIDPAIVERVEVVRGPASVLYGSDAVGGAVLIWTKRRAPGSADAKDRPEGLEVGTSQSFQTANMGWRGSVHASGATATDGWYANATFENWNEIRSGDGEIDNTGYTSDALFGSWSHALGVGQSLAVIARRKVDHDVPRTDRMNVGFGQTFPSSAEFIFTKQDASAATLVYDDARSGSLADRMQLRVYARRYAEDRQLRNQNTTTGVPSGTRSFESEDTLGLGLGADWKKAVGEDHLLTWGVDFETETIDSERTNQTIATGVETAGVPPFAPNSTYLTAGLFAMDEWRAFDALDVVAGVRWSYVHFGFDEFTAGPAGGDPVSGNFDDLTASLQVGREVAPGLRVTAMVAQGFRAPHMDDLAKNSTTFGGQTIANPDLDSEQSLTGELSVDWNNPIWKTSVAVWHTGLSDAIGARLVNDGGTPGVGGDDTYQRDNVGRASLYGFEVQASRKLSGPESDWSLGAGVAWTEGKQYDETINPATGTAPGYDVPFRRVPPLVGELSLEYEPSKPDTVVHWGELSFVAADDQDKLSPEDKLDPRIDPNGTPGWARLDLDVGGPLGNSAGSRWSVGVHNILDRAYRMHGSGLDAPGINAVFGVEWVF